MGKNSRPEALERIKAIVSRPSDHAHEIEHIKVGRRVFRDLWQQLSLLDVLKRQVDPNKMAHLNFHGAKILLDDDLRKDVIRTYYSYTSGW